MPDGTTQTTVLVLLPILYNPESGGPRRPIEEEKFEATMEEIAERFGGGTLFRFTEETPKGYWWDRGLVDEDVLALLEVDVADTQESIDWLKRYARDVLLRRFEQKAIYLKVIGPVETLVVRNEVIAQ